ncbi:MAG: 50S ribosomal protein L29 [Candidatus Bathyarchaeota archaeon]|nr:MAG: 50S ribosomal protein L29 [Candidatus Bathyarchaeota archaeon]
MPNLRMDQIREMSHEQRERRLDELRTELSKLRTMISAGGSVENPGRVRALRRTIAKILTVAREEEPKE